MKILAECYGDTLLVGQLKYEYHAYHSGIGEVANQMRKYYANRRAIAIIDDDKNGPSYFNKECVLVEKKNGVTLLKHKNEDHYVLKITPALEDFIDGAAADCEMELFEKDRKKFRDIVKDRKLHSNQKFVRYLNSIIQKNPPQIKTLKEFIDKAQKGVILGKKAGKNKKKKNS
jgi:hypothetical protein